MKTLPLCLLIILIGCYTSKELFDRGDYYSAVVKSVNRLKQFPSHAKSREILQQAYPLALQSLEAKSQNLIASNDPFKHRNTLVLYGQINWMYELIRTSPAALKVIPKPKNYYREIGELRGKAADETYNAGIQWMMMGTRKDSRKAYQYFSETSAYVPQYKEVIEMLCKAEEDGTLRIMWEESGSGSWWSVSPLISAVEALPFMELQRKGVYDFSDRSGSRKFNLEMNISVLRYSEDFPKVTSSSYEIVDSVIVGEKKVNKVMVPVKKAIKGTYFTYEKKVESRGDVSIAILDKETGSIIFAEQFKGVGQWTGTWNKCTGDSRVFNSSHGCASFEPYPDSSDLREQAEKQIQKDAIRTLTNLLADY